MLPAAQRREALGLEAVGDGERLGVRLQVDPHLPLRAALGGLARLALLAGGVLGLLLLGVSGSGASGSFQASSTGCHCAIVTTPCRSCAVSTSATAAAAVSACARSAV